LVDVESRKASKRFFFEKNNQKTIELAGFGPTVA
jgi:hypothetical protein